jgi:hypothetical protein
MNKITTILERLAYAGWSMHKASLDPRNRMTGREILEEPLDKALQALHAATIAALPKKAKKAYSGETFKEIDLRANQQALFQLQGYNQAIEDTKAAIDELYNLKRGKQ